MKQLLFLLLFPCLALAQYQGNANQKITLGEQTTADGLVFRGVASIDTVTATSKITRANKQDTSAYILLDTVTNLLWHYKTASNGWIQAGGSTLDTATMLLPYYRAGRNTIIQAADVPTLNQNTTGSAATLTTGRTILTNLASTSAATFNGSANITPGVTGVLPLGNGGTGSATQNFVDLTTTQSVEGIKTFTSRANFNSELYTGGKITSTLGNNTVVFEDTSATTGWLGFFRAVNTGGNFQLALENSEGNNRALGTLPYSVVVGSYTANGALHLVTDNVVRLTVLGGGNVGIGTASPAVQFHTTSNVRFAGLASITDLRTDADGDLFNGSDFNLKNSIDTINFGLSDVLKLKPVSFNWNNEGRNISEYKSMGFIAQDVMDVIPNAASTMGDGDMQVDYNAIVATLTKAIQEQQAHIKALEQRILNLENK